MPEACVLTLSGIPAGLEKPSAAKFKAELTEAIRLLTDHLTVELCRTVFRRLRKTERERKWTFAAVAQFWAAMIIRQPASLTQGLAEVRKKRGHDKLWPHVMAESQAFFQKCADLRTDFFQALYHAFTDRLLSEAPQSYASWMADLRQHFPEILAIDGSRLTTICHRLKLLWQVGYRVHPGCINVFYDLFRGVARQVHFYPDAAKSE